MKPVIEELRIGICGGSQNPYHGKIEGGVIEVLSLGSTVLPAPRSFTLREIPVSAEKTSVELRKNRCHMQLGLDEGVTGTQEIYAELRTFIPDPRSADGRRYIHWRRRLRKDEWLYAGSQEWGVGVDKTLPATEVINEGLRWMVQDMNPSECDTWLNAMG